MSDRLSESMGNRAAAERFLEMAKGPASAANGPASAANGAASTARGAASKAKGVASTANGAVSAANGAGSLAAGLDLPALRRAITSRRLRPYEILFDTDRWSSGTAERAERTITAGWGIGESRFVDLRPPIAWDEVLADDRSRHFHLHAWDPLGPVLSAFDQTRDARYLRFALAVALDWIRQYRSVDSTSPFAWYDMAIGLRALRLAYLTDAVARSPFGADAPLTELVRAVRLHQEALSDDGLFPAHSNHGFYFAAGQAALAARLPELPGMEEAGILAGDRLDRLIRDHFTTEGLHREHSPKYHWLVLDTIEGLRSAGFLDGDEHALSLRRMQEAIAWFVLPNGRLAMFGDTDHRLMVGLDWPHVDADALRFVLTGGREGAPPGETLRTFPASGYVVCRSRWPDGPHDFGDASYLAQACAFHSRTHKHADDLTFVWYDRGQEILVDAGAYGYAGKTEPGSDLWKDGFWYADPRRIYVESTRAHNTVQIDGRNIPRRQVDPYGSALVRAGESGGVYFTESAVRHWDSIHHRRVLLFRPSRWLLVLDWLLDDESEPHDFVQRFHFAPELEAEANGANGLILELPGVEVPLHMVSLAAAALVPPVKGQEEPALLGWVSRQDRELIPCWTSGFRASDRPAHTFATLLAFGVEAPDPSMTPGLWGPDRFRVAWTQDGRTHKVTFHQPTGHPFTLDHRISTASGGNGPEPGRP
jgi:hypothetical protein